MTPMEFTWPWTPLAILIIVVVAAVAHVIVLFVIRRVIARVNRIASRGEEHRDGAGSGATAGPGGTAAGGTSATPASAGSAPSRTAVRVTALGRLLKSVWTIVMSVVVLLTVMSTLGVPLSPLLASAGIGGVMLAFGAQSLIKDYLSGISMIVEDQYGVGDQIKVGDITGTVEDITLRITKLRDVNGMIWYVRNGEILKVGNISQGYSTGLVDVPVAYDADVAQVTDILNKVVAEVSADPAVAAKLLEPPKLLGVESITGTTLTMRILIKTPPNQHHGLVRDIRERAIAALTAAGVPAPMAGPSAAGT